MSTAAPEQLPAYVPGSGNQGNGWRLGRVFAVVIVVAAIYLALGVLGLGFAIAPGYASPIFPAAGFAVAMVLWSNKRSWPAIWAGSFALNLGVAWLHGDLGWSAGLVAAGIASGSTVQALVAGWLVVRCVRNGWRYLETERDIVCCLLLAGPVACTISASTAVTLLYWAQIVPPHEYLYAWWNWWSGDTLGVLVMLPISLTLLLWNQAPWRGRLETLVLPMVVTLVLVGVVFVTVAQWEKAEQKANIDSHGEALAHQLEQRFTAHQEALSALRRLLEVTPEMSYSQFEYFTRITLKDNPDIFALSINPYVTQQERRIFEHRMAERTGNAGFEIKERDGQRRLVRATDKAEYVAVGYIVPLEGNRPAVGYDINSDPVRRDAILQAKLSEQPAVTESIQLVQENRKRVGVLVLHPAYRKSAGLAASADNKTLIGFAVGVIKVDEMVEIATQAVRVPGLVFKVDDALSSNASPGIHRSHPGVFPSDNYYVWQKQLAVADRIWTLKVFPTDGYLRQHHHWNVLAVGAGGLALAALLQMLLLITTGRTAIVQRKVQEQTADLQAKSDTIEDRNAQLNALFALSPDGFIGFDGGHRVKYASPAFSSLTGLTEDDVVGLNETEFSATLADRCLPSARFGAIDALLQREDPPPGGKPRRQLIELSGPGDRVLEVGLRLAGAGTVSQILYFRDVTYEAEVDRMKSEFLSTAAHELRTPMASIYGFAEVLLMQEHDEPTRRELLTIIYQQSVLMADVINELLDIARIEARRDKDFALVTMAAEQLVTEAISHYKFPAGREAPRVGAAAPLFVSVDRSKIQQVLTNLLSNAYKYSPNGGEVGIDFLTASEDGKPWVGVAVRDHGMGMTPEQLARVCERFHRADTSGRIPGTGLGMSIAKEIIELLGGELEFASKVGAGTTVTIWLPAISAAPTAQQT
ncbi:MAG: hypothetical protein D4R84_10905 [Rhodocyclaceae bacterium]|nr:MAG: hypothetical protein D4R84_10905 [Rhodocyclaceae bacterium]